MNHLAAFFGLASTATCLAFLPAASYAQVPTSGAWAVRTVDRTSGEPLSDVLVAFPGHSTTRLTSRQGLAAGEGTNGRVRIVATRLGYAPVAAATTNGRARWGLGSFMQLGFGGHGTACDPRPRWKRERRTAWKPPRTDGFGPLARPGSSATSGSSERPSRAATARTRWPLRGPRAPPPIDT